MTEPQPWPYAAANARDRASEAANRGLRILRLLLKEDTTEFEKIRRIAIAVDCFQTIARLLEAQGAKTTVPEE